ncbi:thioesterase [Pseudoxanthomonas jiangsuensis]|uniref:acyl-CoA thioesterase n=1 Tax=Pseudoxanthomonas jiangsuensis TaxID=619688 RepID=UPI002483E82B|nr:acyl-CoA thioesterase [Pseudoxanthomonas jiangsuensis]KAF1697267.1 thioesterase [Pseudoxanthomonas jiangsuensis]
MDEGRQAALPPGYRRRIRWGECDPAGVVYTPRFGDYVIDAYHDFLGQLLGLPLQQALISHDLGTPAKELRILFERSLWPDQEIVLHVRVRDVRRRSFDIAVDAFDEAGQGVFSAKLGLVCVHHDVRKSREIPPPVRKLLCEHRERYPVPADAPDDVGVTRGVKS